MWVAVPVIQPEACVASKAGRGPFLVAEEDAPVLPAAVVVRFMLAHGQRRTCPMKTVLLNCPVEFGSSALLVHGQWGEAGRNNSDVLILLEGTPDAEHSCLSLHL